MKKTKHLFSLLLAACLILGSIPTAYASETEPYVNSARFDIVSMQQPEGGDKIAVNIRGNGDCAAMDVYRSTSKKGTYSKIGRSDSDLNYYDTNVTVGKTYYYSLVPISADGRTGTMYYSYSAQKIVLQRPAFKIYSMKKNIVLELAASDFERDMKYLDWNDYVYGTGFEIYRSTSTDKGFKKIATVTNDTKTYTDKSAKKGVPYTYKIKTYYKDPKTGKIYRSAFSNANYARLGDDDRPSNKAVSLKASYKNGNIKLSWKLPKGFKCGSLYYEYNNDSNSEYYTKSKHVNLKASATSFTIKKAKKNADYYFLLLLYDSKMWKYKDTNLGRSTDYYRIHVNTGLNRICNLDNKLTKISYDSATNKVTNNIKVTLGQIYDLKNFKVSVKVYDSACNDYVTAPFTILSSSKNSCEISYSSAIDSYNSSYVLEAAMNNGKKTQTLHLNQKLFLAQIQPKDISVKKTDQGVKISWADYSSKGAASYKVYRYSYGGYPFSANFETLETPYYVGATDGATSIVDTALKKHGTYYYVVVPINGDFTSDYQSDIRNNGKQFKY